MPVTSAITLPPRDVYIKTATIVRTQTTGTDKLCVLPKNAVIVGFILTGIASNAGTTATLSIGTTSGTPVEYVNAVSVLAGGVGNGVQVLNGVAGAVGGKLTADTPIYFKYAETGGASTLGNWTLHVIFYENSSKLAGVYQ